MRITINVPSYKRQNKVDTLKYIPFCKIWVCATEYKAYKKHYPKDDIISVPKGVQGNVSRIRNYILDNAKSDVICIIDDDLNYLGYFEGNEKFRLKAKEIIPFIKKHSDIAKELNIKLWGMNVNIDKQCYREYTPFSMVSYIGSPFSCHIDSDLRYDERLSLKEDYDITLQHLNKYRKVLRLNKFHYDVKQAKQIGGCAAYRNIERETNQLKLLQKKWGSDIVKYDHNDRSHNSIRKKRIDINPVIRVPIRGI